MAQRTAADGEHAIRSTIDIDREPWVPDDETRSAASAIPLASVESVEFVVGLGERVVIRDPALVGSLLSDLRQARVKPDFPMLMDRGDQIIFRRRGPGPASGAVFWTLQFRAARPEEAFGEPFWRDLRIAGRVRAAEVRALVRRISGDVVAARMDRFAGFSWPERRVAPNDLPALVGALENVTDDDFAYNDANVWLSVVLIRRTGPPVRLDLFLAPIAGRCGVRRHPVAPPFRPYAKEAFEAGLNYQMGAAAGSRRAKRRGSATGH
jgi:hypothetical protein